MRKPLQEIKDPQVIKDFLAAHRYVFISVIDGDEPYIVPLNYGFTLDEGGNLSFYFHASVSGRLFDIVKAYGSQEVKASFGIAEMLGVLKTSIGVCEWDADYRSILGTGVLRTLTEHEDRDRALRVLMDCFGAKPGYEFVPKRMAAVTVYELKVSEFHMKRSKGEIDNNSPETI